MSTTFEWTDDLVTGNDRVDEQHKELIFRLNLLIESVWNGTGQAEAIRIIDFLGNYVIEHFGTEEELMMSTGYPELASHKGVHDAFIQRFLEIRSRFDQEGMKSEIALSILDEVCEWLRNHIKNLDMRLAAFVRQKAAGTDEAAQKARASMSSMSPSSIEPEEAPLQETFDKPGNARLVLGFCVASAIAAIIALYYFLV